MFLGISKNYIANVRMLRYNMSEKNNHGIYYGSKEKWMN